MVFLKAYELAAFSLFNEFQHVITLMNDLLLFVATHVGTQNFGNDLGVKDLLELVYGILVLASVFVQKFVELIFVSMFDVATSDLPLRGAYFILLDLAKTFLEVGQVGSG